MWTVSQFLTLTRGYEYGPFPTKADAVAFMKQLDSPFCLVPRRVRKADVTHGRIELIPPQEAPELTEAASR